jgi:hypothetical protein
MLKLGIETMPRGIFNSPFGNMAPQILDVEAVNLILSQHSLHGKNYHSQSSMDLIIQSDSKLL